jgi:hypothetical protein
MLLPADLTWCPVSLLEIPITFLRVYVQDFRDSGFSPPCCQVVFSGLQEEVILPGTNRQLDPEEGLIFLANRGEVLGHTAEPSETQETARGVSPVRLVRMQVQILVLPLSGRRGT